MSKLSSSFSRDLNGNHHKWYGGAAPEHITSQQCYNRTGRQQSNVRLNDQLIPKPTDINVAEKTIRIANLREHPYSSHISRFAMFPSFRSPDDPETGVRAASQPFLNLLIPNKAPDVTLLRKTIGGPYRHEILEAPVKTRKKAVMWTGENGFLDQTKPLKEENQVFYPAPPKTILPNPKLRDWDLTLSERTSNMLKNLERAQWITSYQMQCAGTGSANPLKIDDFKEQISNLTGMNLHSVPLHRPQEIGATNNEAPVSNQMGRSQSEYRACSTEAQCTELSQEILHKRQAQSKSYEGRQRENCNVWSDESFMRESESQCSQETNGTQISNTERRLNLNKGPYSQTEVNSESSPKEVHQGIHSVSRAGTLGRVGTARSLLDLQNSFSKSEAHGNFNNSITRAAVNLRDNVVSGKKHDFFGINCNTIRG
ncbi:sperm-associated microtubule inner protein 4 [Odontesthes bonariensis]